MADHKAIGNGSAEEKTALTKPATIGKSAVEDAIAAASEETKKFDPNDRLQSIAFVERIDVGRFSYCAALTMCIFILSGFSAIVLVVLSMRNTAVPLISEEVSYIACPNPIWDVPPWGFVKQPNDATSRKIGEKFRYAMPQTILYYSIACASFGCFTVAFFVSELLIQDIGVQRVMQMGDIINKGVTVYLYRTMPVIFMVIAVLATGVIFIAGLNFVISMLVGAITCLMCAVLSISMNFEGAPRLTHAMNYDLPGAVQIGIRAGAIGGLSAHSMAQLGVVMVWMIVRDAAALVGFGAGVSIVAFYNRIGGGIFAKGSDIGSDFVSAMLGEDVDDFNMDALNALRDEHMTALDKDGDGDIDEEDRVALERAKRGRGPGEGVGADDVGFITKEEAEMRQTIEKKMEETLQTMHPVNYLDAIGENIADVGGTCSDLFETMCITLATAVIIGSKAHDVPYFGTSLPFNIISTGTLGCSLVSYYIWVKNNYSPNRIRMHLRLNLLAIIIFVQSTVIGVCYLQWARFRTISFDRMIHYDIICFMGLIAPEICAFLCEIFTSVGCPPVAWIAKNSDLGMIQVILQGLGQGFVSAGVPSVVNIIVQIFAFKWEGFYGLVLLACSSQACTGWQATLAAYGAVANNANRMVHLTTVNEMAHHRSNVCAMIGTTTSHTGKCVAGQNAFFATTSLLGALLADKYTKLGLNFQSTVGQELGEFTRAGMLAGIIFTMLFIANTLTSCIGMAKKLVHFCKGNHDVLPRLDKVFPATHMMPLKTLVAFCAVESFQLTFSPLMNTMAAPLVIGQLFGFKGLIMLVSGGNSVCFSLNMFLINSGQAWDAARKYVLFGMLKDEDGNTVGSESELYDTLGIGEQIGGPLEDLAGPGLNNFIKFVAVVSFVTSSIYDPTPEKTWPMGVLQVVLNGASISFFKFGLSASIKQIEGFFKRRREAVEEEEGTAMLREIEARERKIAEGMENAGLGGSAEDDFVIALK